MIQPAPPSLLPVFLGVSHLLGIGIELAALGTAAPASAAYPAANLALFVPFCLPADTWIVRVGWANGTNSAGTVDCGVYDEGGQRLVSTGSTSQGTAAALQTVAVGPILLAGPARYYLALSGDASGTQSFQRFNPNLEFLKALGMAQAATSHPLPASVTLAALTNAYLPVFGIAQRK